MNDKQKALIQMRASGLSFDGICKELQISKPTAISWSRQFKADIDDLKFQSLADLKQAYRYNQASKYETLLKHLAKVDAAIADADLSNASIKDLITVRNDLVLQLDKIESKTAFSNTGLITKCDITGVTENVAVRLNEL